MLNCVQCGAQNREGSKFCNNCGARLKPQSGLICPMCGTPNQMESVFCANCGARLTPLTTASAPNPTPSAPPIKGLSLPAKPATPPSEKTDEPAATTPADQENTSVPDWLARLRDTAPVDEEPTISPPPLSDDAPDWVKALRSESLEEAPHTPAEPTAPGVATPESDWLTQLRAAAPQESATTQGEEPQAEPEPQLPSTPGSGEAEMEAPSWVEHLSAEDTAEDTEATSEPTAPPWFERASSQRSFEEPPPEETGIPDWLAEIRAPTEAPASQEPSEPAVEQEPLSPPAETEIPDWLSQARTEPVTPADTQEVKSAEDLIQALEDQAPSGEPPPEPATMAAEVATEDLPDWLRMAMPAAQTEAEQPEPALEIPAAPAIEPAKPEEVPAWVAALKPAQLISPSPDQFAGEPAEAAGPLTGLRGVLPLAIAVAEPHLSTKGGAVPVTKRDARLFDSILAEPSSEAELPVAKKAKRVWTIRPLIYLLLALAVIVPFLLPDDLAGSTIRISNTPAAEFYDVIQQLPANSTVVLAFDYDPSMMGEMDAQARAIARDLVRRRIKLIALSTLETGPQIAQRILDDAAAGNLSYRYGSEYLNLGYLPGHEAGLAQLAATGLPLNSPDFAQRQSLGLYPITGNVKTLRDVALVIEFAGTEDALRMWMDQVQSRGVARVAAGVSAGVEPKARAYRDAKQLAALLSGLVGAAQYEILSNQPGLAVTSVNAQSAAQVVLIALIVLGNIVYWISRARGTAK